MYGSRHEGIPKADPDHVDQVLKEVPMNHLPALLPADYDKKSGLLPKMLCLCRYDPSFVDSILWMDESHFQRGRIFSIHNFQSWSIENPHVIRDSHFLHQFGMSVWMGVVDSELRGPYELPARLNGNTYSNFLQHNLLPLLEVANLEVRGNMWLQNDGAPCHYAVQVRQYLNTTFPDKLIVHGRPIVWITRLESD
ncbi:hypothetical protein PR048_002390 [Dryococelus australis]|uniref:Transposable element Tc3 transposase n=1 Tax=Dryococelus australis TaxID=614101 RepID=A0ABQ9IK56_9NEOP|nr:hypothetical protein PR048_002390 [Dryococelus australis]